MSGMRPGAKKTPQRAAGEGRAAGAELAKLAPDAAGAELAQQSAPDAPSAGVHAALAMPDSLDAPAMSDVPDAPAIPAAPAMSAAPVVPVAPGEGASPEYSRRLATDAYIVMGATVLSRLTGFFREMLIPAKFGVGYVADVYEMAFRFPDLMFNLLIGGAISAALIPVLSGSISKGEEREGWQAVSRFINLTMALTVAICIAGSVFSEQLVMFVAQGWDPADPVELEMIRMTARLTRILFPSVAFLMLAGFANSVLYSYQRFAAAAFGPALYNVLCVFSIAFLSSGDSAAYYNVERVVVGVMLSAFSYFVFQTLCALRNIRNRYVLSFDARHAGFRRLFSYAAPALVSSSLLQVNAIVTSSFSSLFAKGSLIALRMADRTWQMPLGIIAQSMGIALLPNLSGRMARGDEAGYRGALVQGLKSVLLLTVPISAAFFVLSRQIMRALFQTSGRVTEPDIAVTALILSCYATSLVTQSVATILTRAFYARNETKVPMVLGMLAIALNIALSVAFYYLTPFGLNGMAVAYSVSSLANAGLLAALLGRKAPSLGLVAALRPFLAKTFAAAGIMSALLALGNRLVPRGWVMAEAVSAPLKIRQLAVLGANAAVGAAVYFALLTAFGLPEGRRLARGALAAAGKVRRRLLRGSGRHK
ncbi:MAG: murein biosynthesis integral membrane protein MurJ [Clostridiales bacterium]|jgi:putative peptidoglycan lipid II flippase|nr:murein biosynthesis integral membrane protein MurJ [Clostridiales bacterium]